MALLLALPASNIQSMEQATTQQVTAQQVAQATQAQTSPDEAQPPLPVKFMAAVAFHTALGYPTRYMQDKVKNGSYGQHSIWETYLQ